MLRTLILGVKDRFEVCVLTRVRDTSAVCEGTFLEGATLEGRRGRLASVNTVFVLRKIDLNGVDFVTVLDIADDALGTHLMIVLSLIICPEILELILSTFVLVILCYVVAHLLYRKAAGVRGGRKYTYEGRSLAVVLVVRRN